MSRYLVTTVRRNTPYTEPSGYIYLIDPAKQAVLQRSQMIEPAFREVDKNPRGGMRGGRGISIRPDELALANASVVYRYDPDWNLLGVVSHPSAAAIHDVLYQPDDSLWVTCARNDLVFQFDREGPLRRHFYLRQPSPATRALHWNSPVIYTPDQIGSGATDFRDPRTHEEETTNHAHVNSICGLPDGSVLVSMGLVLGANFSRLLYVKSRLQRFGLWPALMAANRGMRSLLGMKKNPHSDLVITPAKGQSAVVQIAPDGTQRLVLAVKETTVPSHSLLLLKDQAAVYMNTTAGEVVHFQPESGEVLSTTKVTDGFLRGAFQLDDRTLLLGSKREILSFDLHNRKVLDSFEITQDPLESVYDIKALPDHYANPPLSFEEHFCRQTGFPSQALPQQGYRLPLRSLPISQPVSS